MTDERDIRDAVRSTEDVRADSGYRARLKRSFQDGTTESPFEGDAGRPRKRRLAWLLLPAAAILVVVALLVPRPGPAWTVVALDGDVPIEVGERAVSGDAPDDLAEALRAGGRVRVPDGATLDVRLDDVMVLEFAGGTDATVPPIPDGGDAFVAEVHHGEMRIKTGPGFAGSALHIRTPESRTEIVGTIVSVYKGDGYTCVCVLEGTARVGVDETDLEDVPHDHLKFFFDDGSDPILTDISPEHEADLVEFRDRFEDAFRNP